MEANTEKMAALESKANLPLEHKGRHRQGGWITFPFVAGSMMALGVAFNGMNSNLIVYLIQQLNVKSINATQISNVINGCINLAPIVGAIVSDSFFGYFSVISISTATSLLGMILLTLTAAIKSLRPPPCRPGSTLCQPASAIQFAALYTSIAMVAVGVAGNRFNAVAMGANQFTKAKDRDTFFNWFFFIIYLAFIAGSTAIVYMQDNIGWKWGFGACAALNAVSLAFFLAGKRYYHLTKPEGSPYTGLARVIVAAIAKRKVAVSNESREYYCANQTKLHNSKPTLSLSFFNRAALRAEGDVNVDGSIARPWRLCSLDQVEDLKSVLKILPLWASALFISAPIVIQSNLTVLQALSMDRHLGHHFMIPAGSFLTFTLVASAIALPLLDRFLYPSWHKLTGHRLPPLQRVGVGHVLNTIGMALFAVVEMRRLHIVRSHHLDGQSGSIGPMSALWLIAPLAVVGFGEAFHLPGQMSFYYQEFPASLQSTATAMVAMVIGGGFYLGAAITDLVRRATAWLPDDINRGRVDKVYWTLAVLGTLNFIYFLVCAKLYKYRSTPDAEANSTSLKG